MKKIKTDHYITIQGFMRSDLNLKGNELLLYAIIYSFTQSNQWYSGSRQYLAEWLGCSTRTVQRILDDMVKRGLLIKRKGHRNKGNYCDYKAVYESDKMSLLKRTKCHFNSDKMSHHNNSNNNILNNIYNNSFNIEDLNEGIFDYE